MRISCGEKGALIIFQVEPIDGTIHFRVNNFSFSQKEATTHVLLSSSVDFLDELEGALRKKNGPGTGEIIYVDGENKKTQINNAQLITAEDMVFPHMTVAQNILIDRSLGFSKTKNASDIRMVLAETGFHIASGAVAINLTSEERKIVELLRCYYIKPKLLVIREISRLLSYQSFRSLLKMLELMNYRGTTVLYLTSQWEEALKLLCDVTVVVHRSILGAFTYDEIVNDPSKLCNLVLGRHKESRTEQTEIDQLLSLSTNIQKSFGEYNIHNTLVPYAQYLLSELHAESVVIYLIENNQLIDVFSQSAGKSISETESDATLRFNVLQDFIKMDKPVYANRNDILSNNYYENSPNIMTMIGYPTTLNDGISFFVQINYGIPYVYTEHDTLIINWAAKELSLFLENSRLMGRSATLRESYHRVKNSLQIVTSLMEMEKEAFSQRIPDDESRIIAVDAFNNAMNRIKCIAQIQDILSRESLRDKLVDMNMIVKEICTFYQGHVCVDLKFEQILVPYSKAVSIAMIANELISNSVKHNPQKKDNLRIMIESWQDSNGQMIHMVARDNGVGFPCKNNTTFRANSRGVGLMVIESIVCYEFGGKVEFENQDGALARIEIPKRAFLPVEKREASDDIT